jgi:hypothetical protein
MVSHRQAISRKRQLTAPARLRIAPTLPLPEATALNCADPGFGASDQHEGLESTQAALPERDFGRHSVEGQLRLNGGQQLSLILIIALRWRFSHFEIC